VDALVRGKLGSWTVWGRTCAMAIKPGCNRRGDGL
jgi:hypothetical protein